MAENISSPQDPDRVIFDALLPYASATPQTCTAWIYRTQGVYSIQEFAHMKPDHLHSYAYHYVQWNTGTGKAEKITEFHEEAADPMPLHSRHRIKPLTVRQLCAMFTSNSRNVDSLGHYVRTYIEWGQTNDDSLAYQFFRVLGARCLWQQEQNPLAQEDSPVLAALRMLRPEDVNFPRATEAISKMLGDTILTHHKLGLIDENVRQVTKHTEELLRTASHLDAQGILPPGFWFQYGVLAKGVFSVPGMLEYTFNKLASEGGIASLQLQEVTSVESTMRAYVDSLFAAYMHDKTRDGARLAAFRSYAANDRGSSGLSNLVKAANLIITAENQKGRKLGASPEELLPLLDPTDSRDWAEGLIRIFIEVEPKNLSDELRNQHATEDAMHAAIFEFMRQGLRSRRTQTRSASPSHFNTAQEMITVLDSMRRGAKPSSLAAYFTRRKRSWDS